MSRSQLSFVGLFVIGGVLMFAVGVFMIGDRRALFAERFELSPTSATSPDFRSAPASGSPASTPVRSCGSRSPEARPIGSW